MSFGTYARRVRDRDLPYGLRHSALRCAVSRYKPLGFHATWDFITARAGNVRRDETALLAALDLLEASRTAWHAELAEFARRRTIDKRHRRTVSVQEQRYLYGWRWPGPDGHAATVQTITALWKEHTRVGFPPVPAALKPDLVELDSTVAGIIWTYLRRDGNLNPAHRHLIKDCLTELRALRLGYPRDCYEAFHSFLRLEKAIELVVHDALPLIRPGWAGDADEISRVFLAARNQMTYLPRLYTDAQTRAWITEIMIPASRLWVAERGGRVVGFAALRGSWLDHLYVAPDAQDAGVGTALLDQAMKGQRRLDLHVFQQNTDARRLYDRHGFTLVDVGDGSGNEENLPDAHLRWQNTGQRPLSGLDESLTCAFPIDLADDVQAVTSLLPRGPYPSATSFQAVVGEDRVTIPERIYHQELTPEGLSSRQQTILHCLFSRHHDGFVRQRHLRQILTCTEPWVLPYILRLAGDYVIEIVTDVHAALADLTTPGSPLQQRYGRFMADNPDLLPLIEQRTASYWACHHRTEFPRLADYPGRHLVTALQTAAASVSRRLW